MDDGVDMPHHPIPKDAPQFPKDPKTGAPLIPPPHIAMTLAWTTVTGTATPRVQTEEGMGKGSTVYDIHALCPKCEDDVSFTGAEHGAHPFTCHCSPGHCFTVKW
jgi:hypothetical protein